MRVIVAPQEYKGTLTCEEAAAAIAEGVRRAVPGADIETVPMPDGGPGTVRAIAAVSGGERRTHRVQGPLGRPVEAEWAFLPDGTAIIEMAAAAGLMLLVEDERDPRDDNSWRRRTGWRGAGLRRAAVDRRPRR